MKEQFQGKSGIDIVKQAFGEMLRNLEEFSNTPGNLDLINHFGKKLAQSFLNGNKIISCGNGGSMCDAMHFAEEFTGRFRKDRVPLPAIAISDPSHITCTANDYGYEYVFSRYVEGVAVAGDLLLGISTSGNSQNVFNAIVAAKQKKVFTVALLGKDGGKIKNEADLSIIVPGETSDRIQELHIKIIHTAIELTESYTFSSKS